MEIKDVLNKILRLDPKLAHDTSKLSDTVSVKTHTAVKDSLRFTTEWRVRKWASRGRLAERHGTRARWSRRRAVCRLRSQGKLGFERRA